MKYLFAVLLFANLSLYAQTKSAGVQLFLMQKELKHASVGICIKDLSGKEIISHNADKSYTPASILKVVTTATALDILGAEYKYQTTLAKDKNKPNRLLIHGYGDPTLGTKHLDNIPNAFLSLWAEQVSKNFDSSKRLDITVIDEYFGYDGISQRWIYQDMGNYYAAGAYGISIYDNTYQLYLDTSRRDTCPIIVKTNPEMNITFTNTLQLNNTGEDNGYIHGETFSTKRLLSGNIPAGRKNFSIKGDIPNPGLYLANILAEQLEKDGFAIGKLENTREKYYREMYSNGKESFNENIFYTHLSFPLEDIIRETNVKSNNHYAEHLIRSIGRSKNNDIYTSPLDTGIEKTEELWKDRGLNTDALFMFDGSGLAPSNAVSPQFICDLLIYMQTKSENADTFLNSLPKAGKEGTVRSLLKGTRLEGKVFVKSGSINGVQCFAGYYIDGNKKYAFTVMVNKFKGSRSQVVKGIEKLLLSVF